MRRATLACVSVLAVGATLSATEAPADAATRSTCIPKRGKTKVLARTNQAIVFQRMQRDEHGPFALDYACLLRVGKRVRLGIDDYDLNEYISHVTIAGRFVGWVVTEYEDLGDSGDAVYVLDLQSRRRVLAGGGQVQRVVLAPSGAVAWSSMYTEGDGGEPVHAPASSRIRKFDTHGPQLLDCGAGVAVGSLRLQGTQITWSNAGTPRSWTLDRPLAEQAFAPPAC